MNHQSFFNTTAKIALVLIVLSSLAFGQSKNDRGQARKFKELANRAYSQKNYRDAADLYGKALALVSNDAETHYRKAFAHNDLKENDVAIQEFTLALSKGYKPLEIYRIRHYIYFEQKNYDAALSDAEKGLAIAPADGNLLSAIGEIHLERKSYAQALLAFDKAIKASKAPADLHYNKARVYFATGQPKEQAASASTAVSGGTRFPGDAFYLLGDAHQKSRNYSGAIDAYQRAIFAKPSIYQSYRNLSEVFRGENRFADAINVSKQGLVAFPKDGNLYTDLSLYYSLADRHQDAVQAGKAGTSLLPNQSTAHTYLCRAYNETKEFSLAIASCNAALRLKPGDGETLFYLGRAFNLSGKTTEANRYYSQAVTGLVAETAKNPMNSEAWYLLGNAYFTDNQRDKAIDAYLKSLDITPKFAKARYNLGIIYTLKKNKAGAAQQYDRLVTVDAKLAERLKTEIDNP